MTESFGTGVSRVLEAQDAAYDLVVFQQDRPLLDSELNFVQQLARVRSKGISGWLASGTYSFPFVTSSSWSNWFQFGIQRPGDVRSFPVAQVNGWTVAVTGTATGTPPGAPDDVSTWNRVRLSPPPSNAGDTRVDFVFLEVWRARLAPTTSTNKPSSSTIYRHGNVESGMTFLPDESLDPAQGYESTQRVQVQYRIRVVDGIGLSSYPSGFDPVLVKARGTSSSDTSFSFSNMRETLGDPGLWRAGDGLPTNSLGTVDGYVYALPIAAVFRRNSVVWSGAPSPNLNGGNNRNPTAVDRSGWKTFVEVSLSSSVTATATTFPLSTATNIPFPLSPSSPVLAKINDEIVSISSISGLNATVTRGVNGSKAVAHTSGSTLAPLSSRPDGLFSDQVASTDILDLRHTLVADADWKTLLRQNFDALLRGQLLSSWKKTGGGVQGPVCLYQDKVSSTSTLGLTKLDTPDNFRTVWSDSSVVQKVVAYVRPAPAPIGSSTPVQVSWGQTVAVNCSLQSLPNQFRAGDILTIPILQFKSGLGLDTDQVRFVNDGIGPQVISVRDEGSNRQISVTVTPGTPGTSNDLQIEFNENAGGPSPVTNVVIEFYIQYGGGRGVGLRPDTFHQATLQTNTGGDFLLKSQVTLTNNYPLQTAWALLDSSFRRDPYAGRLPVAAESYVDPGSKTLVLKPFRRVPIPTLRTMDGALANLSPGTVVVSAAETFGTDILEDLFTDFVAAGVTVGMVVRVNTGANVGDYTIVTVAPGGNVNRLQLGSTLVAVVGQSYSVKESLGLMPTLASDGVTPKWATVDPLNLFACSVTGTDNNAAQKNLYVQLPRSFVPGWGEYRLPLLWADTSSGVFHEGANFLLMSKKNPLAPVNDSDQSRQFINYLNGSLSYAVFSTHDLNALGTMATYNSAFVYSGFNVAGIRFFTDARGIGRSGLELPPFYGPARLFAVYEAQDYVTNGSAYNASTREVLGAGTPATNLLRSDFKGPLFWVEKDDDGDSTFILNAEALDLSKSPNPIASFATGKYVIEASIFGFDRNAFDTFQDFRLVLSRPTVGGRTVATDNAVRSNNVGVDVPGPNLIIQAPLQAADQAVVSYSRTPYMGDAWGSQLTQNDIASSRGPLTTANAYAVVSDPLDQEAVTRNNQKTVTVLASMAFATTLGTGRVSGDPPAGLFSTTLDLRQGGYESFTSYPPVSGSDPRPDLLLGVVDSSDPVALASYAGCTERLPLGSLFRDYAFRGNSFSSEMESSSLVFWDQVQGIGSETTSVVDPVSELVDTCPLPGDVGQPVAGSVLVHTDGNSSTMTQNTTFRTTRGGALFVASGPRPGAEFSTAVPDLVNDAKLNALCGVAMLVRNEPTTVGATSVSSGDEIMLLVVTSVARTPTPDGVIRIGTNGLGEGFAAADLFRVLGHPLAPNPTKAFIDPNTVTLAKRIA